MRNNIDQEVCNNKGCYRFITARGRSNAKYCSKECYEEAKKERSRKNYKNKKIKTNDLIAEIIISRKGNGAIVSLEELNKENFDLNYYREMGEDELGTFFTLENSRFRILFNDTIQFTLL